VSVLTRTAALFLVLFVFAPFKVYPEVVQRTLPNGLQVLMAEDHKSPLAVFQIWYRVGSMDESFGKTGLSHVLEHMMFKGTKKYGSKEFSRTIQRYGGTDNAFTSMDSTVYFQILPSEHLDLSLKFESDRMANLLLREEDFQAERAVVMEERRLRLEDDPQSSLYEETEAAAFRVHPYHWPVIGWMPDLAHLKLEDLKQYYRTHYTPNNAFIVVVGDIDPDALFKEIEKYFGSIKPSPPPEDRISQEPPLDGERRVYLDREAELPYVVAAYHVPTLLDEDGYALDVLSTILGGGRSGRLYRSLIYEQKVALNVFADYGGLHRDPYLFTIGGTVAPGASDAALEKALYAEVERLKEEPVSDFELAKAKNQIEADFIMRQDSIFSQAMTIGRFHLLKDWRLKDRYVENIRAVTAEDVRRVARKYFDRDKRTVGILIPEARQAQEDGKGKEGR
jgi:zinc protease